MKREESLENKESEHILYKILGLEPTCTLSEIVKLTRKRVIVKWH